VRISRVRVKARVRVRMARVMIGLRILSHLHHYYQYF